MLINEDLNKYAKAFTELLEELHGFIPVFVFSGTEKYLMYNNDIIATGWVSRFISAHIKPHIKDKYQRNKARPTDYKTNVFITHRREIGELKETFFLLKERFTDDLLMPMTEFWYNIGMSGKTYMGTDIERSRYCIHVIEFLTSVFKLYDVSNTYTKIIKGGYINFTMLINTYMSVYFLETLKACSLLGDTPQISTPNKVLMDLIHNAKAVSRSRQLPLEKPWQVLIERGETVMRLALTPVHENSRKI